jgi:hypothetical protein
LLAIAAVPWKTLREPADALRTLWLDRYETGFAAVAEKFSAGDYKAIETALAISDRVRALMGLDALKRTEITGSGGGPLQHVALLAELSTDELRAALEALRRGDQPALPEPERDPPPSDRVRTP